MELIGDAFLQEERLRGKVAIITGGASGIGAATAKLFALNGAHVIIADILDDLGSDLAKEIGGRYIHCDVSRESDVEAAVDLALKQWGQLDIMFNNAGIGGPANGITRLDMDEMREVLAVNLVGMVHGIKYGAIAMMAGGRGGCILCTASTAATVAGLGFHAYTASKAAVLGLARSAAVELGQHKIRVNCISPHGVPTEMLVSGYRKVLSNPDIGIKEINQIVRERGSLIEGRIATVEDAARAALFLASDDASFITAQNLVVDGGYTSADTRGLKFIYQ